MPIDVIEHKNFYSVTFPYNKRMVDAIKKIEGRRFVFKDKSWNIPVKEKEALVSFITTFSGGNGSASAPDVRVDFPVVEMPELTVTIPTKRAPYHYQNQGIAYNLEKKRVLIGDEPGLGKTGQAIVSVLGADMFPCLVICPAKLRRNWRDEWKVWTDNKAAIMHQKSKKKPLKWGAFLKMNMIDVFICNYESIEKYFIQEIKRPKDEEGNLVPLTRHHITPHVDISLFKSVIIDESHRCKDGTTRQSKFAMKICEGKEMVLLLTGTPVINKPVDLIPQLVIMNQLDALGGYKYFMKRYGHGDNLKELNHVLQKTCFYRRLKKDVLKDLPDKTRQIIRTSITNRDEYEKAYGKFRKYLQENLKKSEGEITRAMRAEILVQMGILRQVSARGKFEETEEQIRETVESGQKIVVFAHHGEILDGIGRVCRNNGWKYVQVRGGLTDAETDQAVTSFQACKKCGVKYENHTADHDYELNDVSVIIVSINAGGVGLTLTAAYEVLFVEFPWHPAACDQCTDRTHRISQKNAVRARYTLGVNTVDESMYDTIEKKRAMATQITGDEDMIDAEFIDALLKDMSTAAQEDDNEDF